MAKPWNTDYDFSYVFVTESCGNAKKAVVKAIPRSFDVKKSDQLVKVLKIIAKEAATLYEVGVEFKTEVQYVTTKTAIDDNPELLQVIINAHKDAGVGYKSIAIKAGTDSAMINRIYPKIPAPNMGAGGYNFHSCQEFLVAEQLLVVPQILMNAISGYANFGQY